MHIVVRRWTNAAAMAEAMTNGSQEVEELLRGVPGFVAYYATQDGDAVTSITVCDDRDGTQESTRRAREWVRQNVSGAAIGAPDITEGETFIQFSA